MIENPPLNGDIIDVLDMVPFHSDVEKYQSQALSRQFSLASERLKLLIERFIRSNTEARQFQDNVDKALNDLRDFYMRQYEAYNLKPDLYNIDPELGAFVKKESSK